MNRMIRFAGWMGAVLIASVCGVTASARAQEMDIPLDQLPKPVLNAAKAKFPGAELRGAAKETEDGKTVYEVSLTHKTKKIDSSWSADGTLLLVETELAEADVPAAATKAVKAKYPGAKVELVESIAKGPELKTQPDYYEFHLKTPDNKSVEAEVDGTGKILN
jgi:uncharacterized membrane protein YkoI